MFNVNKEKLKENETQNKKYSKRQCHITKNKMINKKKE